MAGAVSCLGKIGGEALQRQLSASHDAGGHTHGYGDGVAFVAGNAVLVAVIRGHGLVRTGQTKLLY
jgi:hypothetical protein